MDLVPLHGKLKTRCWRSEKPDCPELYEAIKEHFDDFLFGRNGHTGWSYNATDTKVGIDVEALEQFVPTLKLFMAIDPRGGFFRQRDMKGCVYRCSQRVSVSQVFSEYCAKNGYGSINEGITRISHMYRVVCGHLREKFQQFNRLWDTESSCAVRSHPRFLREVYDLITADPSPSRTRLHPFPAFRAADSDDTDDEIDDVTIVDKNFDVSEFKAVCALSTGEAIYADRYRRGDNALAVAIWDDLNVEMELEVSASCITEDGDLKRPVPVEYKKGKQPRKRPAAASATTPASADEDANKKAKSEEKSPIPIEDGEPSEPKHSEKILELLKKVPKEAEPGRLVPGRKSYTLEASSSGSIISVILNGRGTFYIKNVKEETLTEAQNMAMFKDIAEGKALNKKGDFQVSFGDDPKLAFDLATYLAFKGC